MNVTSSLGSTALVKRACDSCRQKKTKCIVEGTDPCKRCVSAELTCTYNAIPQKKGRRGKVLATPRKEQRNTQLSTDNGLDNRPLSGTFARTKGLISHEFVRCCIGYFFDNVCDTVPALDCQTAQQAEADMDRSEESYCMVAALCAYVVIWAKLQPPEDDVMSDVDFGNELLKESVCVRKGYNYYDNPTFTSRIISRLHSLCYTELGYEDVDETRSQEARLLDVHHEATCKHDAFGQMNTFNDFMFFPLTSDYYPQLIPEETRAFDDPRYGDWPGNYDQLV